MRKLIAFLDDLNQDYLLSLLEDTPECINNFVQSIAQSVEPFYLRKDTVFYDGKSIDKCCTYFEELSSNSYRETLRERLRIVLENACDWRHKPKQETIRESHSYFYFSWHFESYGNNTTIKDIKNTTLAELSERILQADFNEKRFVLVVPKNACDTHPYKHPCSIVTIKEVYPFKHELPIFIEVKYTTDAESWIKENRTPLCMNRNNKHGENGRRAHRRASILYCSIDEAQNLLNSAIGDARYSSKEKWLYNYDQSHEKFIAFPYENETPQNQYHAFHYETIEDAQREIPAFTFKRLKQKFSIR